uniref:Uncharacterized protein n=1 Tax=Rhizophora mucronata TaxID=61149 RepID=A0A2P2NCQ4_RHIMU
MKQKQGKQN